MKPTYVNNIPLMQGEVSVVMSDSVTDSVRHSAELAKQIRSDGVNVLLLNCGMSDQQFRHAAEPIVDSGASVPACDPASAQPRSQARMLAPQIVMRSVVRGNVVEEGDAIYQIVRESRIGVIILNSWEWTSSSWQRKNNLLYYLRCLMEDTQVAVIIYSTATTKPEPRMPDRGGIGRLAELALYVTHLAESDKLKETTKRPKPIVLNGKERREMEQSVELIVDKLKGYSEGQGAGGKGQVEEEVHSNVM